jgi:hypothetical protein
VAFIATASIALIAAGVKVAAILIYQYKSGGIMGLFDPEVELPRNTLVATLDSLILGLADQQMVTGLAILVAGLKDWDAISGYHFNHVVYMAWLSSFTHAVALVSLRRVMKGSIPLLVIRIIGFSSVFILLVVSQDRARTYGQTASLEGESSDFSGRGAACPAKCGLVNTYGGWAHQYRIASIAILIFWWLLSTCFSKSWQERLSAWIVGFPDEEIFRKSLRVGSKITYSIILVGVFYGLEFSILGALKIRNTNNYPGLLLADNFEDQNTWNFGQLVAVILLMLPVLAAVEGYIS